MILHSRDEFSNLVSAIDSIAEQRDVAPSVVFKITLALDELVSNIFDYAFPGIPEPQIDVVVCVDNGVFFAKIIDNGIPFDMSKLQEPEVDKPLEERKRAVGGLGVFLVRRLMDSFTYYRYAGRNYAMICTKLDSENSEKGAGDGNDYH
ncbi:ATP-binding protein [Halodesulfovibrio spirochaetisodalis]|uniref:ATP-binding protein n=1 Tax=Halodesulfovibrio spirochaetisodalis TaxID=1560234 RepID=UPI0018D2B47D|nr:ATP-binding protein [Halodesulfovibrio spirochaetisodalis]